MYQVLNPDEYTFILKRWEHSTAMGGKIWSLIHDERYDNKLLHCTMSVKEAKCFAVSKEHRIYDTVKAPVEQKHDKQNKLIDTMHIRFSHSSRGELKMILTLNLIEFLELRVTDIEHCGIKNGEGFAVDAQKKKKDHARIQSSKPL